MSRRLFAFAAILFGAHLQGCTSQVAMLDPHIPDPLIAKLPMKIAVRYPDSFNAFVHEERVIGKEVWKIDLGASNRLLFDQLLGSMFSDVTELASESDPDDFGIDALIEPSIDAFEFSIPEQSQTDAFAVWIRYRIKIFDSAGTQVANWPIAAYGKSQTSTFGGDDALRRAAVLAMRDAAALIILQMDKATGISKLRRTNSVAPDGGSPDVAPAAAQADLAEDRLNEGI
ncbi:MAG: hypothetical protein WBN23_09655 [Woeseia sp.]